MLEGAVTSVQCGNCNILGDNKEHAMESAKRRTPVVKPVVVKGVRYEQMRRAKDHGFTQSGGVIAAVEDKTDKILWCVQLYKTEYDAAQEQDVQEVYVKELALDESGHALLATDERQRVWSIDLSTHVVTLSGAAASH
jgi:hypothetical protein